MFTARTPFALTVVVALSAVGLISGAAAAQAAKPGNSLSAKACQKLGWKTLVTSTGQDFTSESQCTSYAAGGGTLVTKPTSDPRCTDPGYLDLFRQDGTVFTSEADCNSYAQGGGQLVKLKVTDTGLFTDANGAVYLTTRAVGFGLRAGSGVQTFGDYSDGWEFVGFTEVEAVATDGTLDSGAGNVPCDDRDRPEGGFDGDLREVYVRAITAAGVQIRSRRVQQRFCPSA